MTSNRNYSTIEKHLQSAMSAAFKNAQVKIGDGIHYKGCNIVITSPDFSGLLPEQRFHHVAHALPVDLYEQLRTGFVWFELAPGELPVKYMKMPRSEDIAAQDSAIQQRLMAAKFFKKFEAKLRASRRAASTLDFILAKELLAEEGWTPDEITRACLFFIRHGGHCDADVFSRVMENLNRDEEEEDRPAVKKPGNGTTR